MRRIARPMLVVALYLLVALVQTAPLAPHLTTSIPFGNDTVPTIARFNLWMLWWNGDRLRHGYRGYWDAPIFYPERFSFVYSEPQWLTGLLASPLWWLSGNPALTYDAVVLAAVTLGGIGGYVLLRRLDLRFGPALCGGLLMEMLPTTVDQLGVLQSTTVVFPILMTLACLVRFARTARPSSALGIALWMAAAFHTSSNMALFFAPAVLLGVVVLAGRLLLRPRTAVILGLGAVLSALLIVPVAVVQSRVLGTIPEYTYAEIAGTSAHLGTYTWMAPTNVLRRRPPDRKEATLSPGPALPALALLGAWYGVRRRRLRRWTFYALLAMAGCVLLSFGPLLDDVRLGAVLGAPYRLMRAWYPGFRFARNLWRFGGLAQVFLATLAALGVAACFGGRRAAPRRALLGIAVTAAVAVDLLATPVPLLDLGDPTRLEWLRWLHDAPADTTVVHIPMPGGLTAEDFERTTYWMDCQMFHGHRIANGYAAYIPSRTALLIQVMPNFPDRESIRALQYFGIEHVLASPEWMTADHLNQVAQWHRWVIPELATKDVAIYRIVGATAQAQ
jgi:hypothetical protein